MMKQVTQKKKRSVVAIMSVVVCLLAAVLFLMDYVRMLLYSDVRINLTEIVAQNRDVIASKLSLELTNLTLASSRISERLKQQHALDDGSLYEALEAYSSESKDSQLFVSNAEGVSYFSDGQASINVMGRNYFRLSLSGIPNISERIVSRTTGADIFVISVPLYMGANIVGTAQRYYTPQEMYELCSLTLFSAQGTMRIVNGDGYILVSSDNVDYSNESDNYFRMLYSQGNVDASKFLAEDIANNQSGFMETVDGGKKNFSAYTPMENIPDWYLITSVDTNAVSPNANTVIRMFYFILCLVVLAFAFSLFYFFWLKNKQRLRLETIAFVDTLTGGDTYNKFSVELVDILRASPEKRYALLAFDIDNFKYINNYYGFEFGDRVLRHIHSNIRAKLLPSEMLAHVSGDHFVSLLHDFSEERLAELLPPSLSEDGVSVYFSAGVYEISNSEESVNLMTDKAATAALKVKGSLHQSIAFYSGQIDREITQREQLKRKVQQALTNGEFIPYFQPKVDAFTGALVGAEALARWVPPDGRMVPPADFIPLCERTGLIMNLDMAIFQQVLDFLHSNLSRSIACVPISVNFSRLHLMDEEFIHAIIAQMEQRQVPPHLIEIELTESVFFENDTAIQAFANHLHDHGLLLCMDDFGSGYSSLNMLKNIPIDVLKIDKAFLESNGNPERQRIILSTIAQMAKRLRIDVVVEGVETRDNVDLIKELGCPVAQGYYYAKPMDRERFEKIFVEGKLCTES